MTPTRTLTLSAQALGEGARPGRREPPARRRLHEAEAVLSGGAC